jgi:hypothetical protein
MVVPDTLQELQVLCPGASVMEEAGREYIFLPSLKLPSGRQPAATDGLLCLSERDGYPTRLFLGARYAECGANWNEFRILDRTWHSWSWNHVAANQRPMQILAEHVRALR